MKENKTRQSFTKMGLLENVLFNFLNGNDEFCCLCFEKTHASADTNQVYEFFNEKADLATILKYLFKQDVFQMFNYGVVCDICKAAAVNSYKFMKTFEINFEKLHKAIDTIANSVTKTEEDVSDYKTLFITLNLNDFTCQQYYDVKKCSFEKIEKRLIKLKEEKEKLIILCNGNSMAEYNKIIKLKRQTHKRNKVVYDIPSVPDSELMFAKESSTFECIYCLKSFKERTALRKHCFKFHYPRNVKCPHCEKAFLNEILLEKHVKKFHIKMKCTQCRKTFKNRQILMKHVLNHGIKLVCQDCNRVYKSKEGFKSHFEICKQSMRRKSEQGTYICDYCDKRYCVKAYLAKHIMYEHENAEGFRCRSCDKQFYCASGLKVHMYKHTQEKNFECKICNRFFVTKTSLLYHTRLHTGERPYKCEHCDQAFLSASRRINHVRIHHMAPSFGCSLCPKKFKSTGSLLRHKKRHFNPNSRLNICRT